MDFVALLSATALDRAIGDLIYTHLYGWVATWSDGWSTVGAFSVTVIVFTVLLKILTFPLDVWQKESMRKNAKKMELMRPQLEKLQKQCGSNREMLMQKQRELYKKHQYSLFGSCLPMIVTMVVFFVVFGGFNAAVNRHSKETYVALEKAYKSEFEAAGKEGLSDAERSERAGAAAVEAYDEKYQERFVWIKSIFAGDNWQKAIPDAGTAEKSIPGLDTAMYKKVTASLAAKYNSGWNGYLVLPILVLALNLLSLALNKDQMRQPAVPGQTEEQAKSQQAQSKMMQFIMPIMMFMFALFYSAAFTLYMMVNMLLSTIINLLYNLIVGRRDRIEKDRILSTTYK